MKTTTNFDKLLKYMYDEYEQGHNAHGRGEFVQVLVAHYERSSGNRIGDAHVQAAAVRYLQKNGWIDVVDILGNKITNSLRAYTTGRMQPSQKGLEYLRQKRLYTAEAAAKILGNFFGGFFKP
jgi:hypothetical protein